MAPYIITGIQDACDPTQQAELRKVPLRLEVDDWYTSQQLIHVNQRALFFPAFWEFSQMNPHEKLSWFQIAGIHGKPFIAWDEAPQKGETENKGYCTHNSILFCTWHRPYLLLWEQVIHELMKKELAKYSDYPKKEQDELREALDTWRFPYWDWAQKKHVPTQSRKDYTVPSVMKKRFVDVRQPTLLGYGRVPNAFYQFTMPKGITMGDESLGNKDKLLDLKITPSHIQDKDGDFDIPFDKCTATSRHPTSRGVDEAWINGSQNNLLVEQNLRDYKWDPTGNLEFDKDTDKDFGNMTASLRDAFYRVVTMKDFEDFATKRLLPFEKGSKDKGYGFASAENLHDNMHGWCGGGLCELDPSTNQRLMGHMSHVPLAAFDPIFWLHHCNVDRLIAIWQTLHDDSWFDLDNEDPGNKDPRNKDPRNEDGGTFAIPKGHVDRPTDILRPFHKAPKSDEDPKDAYWTSKDCQHVTALGYTYAGLEKWKFLRGDGTYDKVAHIEALTKSLNFDYNSAWTAAEKSALTKDPGEANGVGLMSLPALQAATKQEVMDLEVYDYVVNVVYEKFALGGNGFVIHIFVGDVPASAPYTFEGGWQVGQIFNFSTEPGDLGASEAGCGNCQNQQLIGAQSSGRVVLTNALITRWKNQIEHGSTGDKMASMEPRDVVPFLKRNLSWRVSSFGADVALDRLASLKVSVAVGKAKHYVDRTKLSEFGEYVPAYEVTEGKVGGVSPADGLYADGEAWSDGQ